VVPQIKLKNGTIKLNKRRDKRGNRAKMIKESRIRLTPVEKKRIIKGLRAKEPLDELDRALIKRLRTEKRGKGHLRSPRFKE